MIDLEVTTDNKSGLAGMISGLTSQLPFAYSVALNNTANDSQSKVRVSLRQHFTLRRPEFIDRTIYIGPQDRARKDRLAATVRVHPERDVLRKFEEGEDKRPKAGRSLAIPVVRESQPTLIIRKSDPLSLKRLFDAINNRRGQVKARRRKGEALPLTQIGRVFLVDTATGTYIVERVRPGAGGTRVLYSFEKETPIDERLEFAKTARDAALMSWDRHFTEALAHAIATMR